MSDLASETPAEVAVTLPDGAVRRYPAGITGAEVAADISKSLGKAALAVTHRRAARRPLAADREGRGARRRHRAGRGAGARADPPRRGAHHGARGAGALARRQGDDRPGDRERLVLRLRPRGAVHARGPRGDQPADAADHRRARPGQDRGLGPRPGDPPLRGDGRDLQGRAGRGDPRGRPGQDVLARALAGPLPRAAPRQYRAGAGGRLQADVDRRRLLARRHRGARCCSGSTASAFRTKADLDAYLHRLEEAQKRDHRRLGQGDGSLPPAAGGAGVGVLAPERLHALAGARGLYPPPARRGRLRRGEDAAAPRRASSGGSRGTGASSARTCSWCRTRSPAPTRTSRSCRARPTSWR